MISIRQGLSKGDAGGGEELTGRFLTPFLAKRAPFYVKIKVSCEVSSVSSCFSADFRVILHSQNVWLSVVGLVCVEYLSVFSLSHDATFNAC